MSAVLPWLGVALALLAWPTRRSAPTSRPAPATRPSAVRRERVVAAVAVAGAAAVCLGLLGPARGIASAAVACPALVWGLRRLRDRPSMAERDPSVALALELAAAVLRSGRPVPEALALAAPAALPTTEQALTRTARLLALGAEPALAWAGGSPGDAGVLAPVAEAAVRSHTSGARLADTFERVAAELRADCAAAALARAQRAGTHALGPLAACFLPSFVCLGIIPVIVGVAHTVLGSVTR